MNAYVIYGWSLSGADKLASLRGEMENFVGLSFDTISSIGPNGAIIHYKPSAGMK